MKILKTKIAAFLIHVGARQLPTYIEKSIYYHVGKKVTDVGFV